MCPHKSRLETVKKSDFPPKYDYLKKLAVKIQKLPWFIRVFADVCI